MNSGRCPETALRRRPENPRSFLNKKATPSGIPDASGFLLAAGGWRLGALSFGALAASSLGFFR
jgi:hypothetical protein